MNSQEQQHQHGSSSTTTNNDPLSPVLLMRKMHQLTPQQIEQLPAPQKFSVVNAVMRDLAKKWQNEHPAMMTTEDIEADRATERAIARNSLLSMLVCGTGYVYLTKPTRYGPGQFYSPITGALSRMVRRVRPFNPPTHPLYSFVVFAATYAFHVSGPLRIDAGKVWMNNAFSLLTPRSFEMRRKMKEYDPERLSGMPMEVLEYDANMEQSLIEKMVQNPPPQASFQPPVQQQQQRPGSSVMDQYFDSSSVRAQQQSQQQYEDEFSDRRRERRRSAAYGGRRERYGGQAPDGDNEGDNDRFS